MGGSNQSCTRRLSTSGRISLRVAQLSHPAARRAQDHPAATQPAAPEETAGQNGAAAEQRHLKRTIGGTWRRVLLGSRRTSCSGPDPAFAAEAGRPPCAAWI